LDAAGDKRLLLGKIVGLFGVDGWVKVESYTEPRAQIFKYRRGCSSDPVVKRKSTAPRDERKARGWLRPCLELAIATRLPS
jgi:RimM protein, required for 16S rRNA processing